MNARAIAGKLTPAQRTAIEQAHWSSVFGRWHLPFATNLGVVRVLATKGLLCRSPGWKLNAAGVEVRELLTKGTPDV